MERVKAKTLHRRCNVARTRAVVKDRFNFVYVLMPVWIPYTGCVFEFRRTRVRYVPGGGGGGGTAIYGPYRYVPL